MCVLKPRVLVGSDVCVWGLVMKIGWIHKIDRDDLEHEVHRFLLDAGCKADAEFRGEAVDLLEKCVRYLDQVEDDE